MKALTVKQPWAQLICDGIKPVENRTWKTKFRGRVLIHASAKPERVTLEIEGQATVKEIEMLSALNFAEENNLFGCVIGSVEIVDCVQNHPSIWAEQGVWNWVLANPVLFDKPIEHVKGKLSFWEYDGINEVTIECPKCGSNELAIEDFNAEPFFGVYVHECKKCGYIITESEWNVHV